MGDLKSAAMCTLISSPMKVCSGLHYCYCDDCVSFAGLLEVIDTCFLFTGVPLSFPCGCYYQRSLERWLSRNIVDNSNLIADIRLVCRGGSLGGWFALVVKVSTRILLPKHGFLGRVTLLICDSCQRLRVNHKSLACVIAFSNVLTSPNVLNCSGIPTKN